MLQRLFELQRIFQHRLKCCENLLYIIGLDSPVSSAGQRATNSSLSNTQLLQCCSMRRSYTVRNQGRHHATGPQDTIGHEETKAKDITGNIKTTRMISDPRFFHLSNLLISIQQSIVFFPFLFSFCLSSCVSQCRIFAITVLWQALRCSFSR